MDESAVSSRAELHDWHALSPGEVARDAVAHALRGHPARPVFALSVIERHIGSALRHVSNVEFVRWIDRLAECAFDASGFPRPSMVDDGVAWFVARHEIDYRLEAFIGDEMLATTWVSAIDRVKATRETRVLRRRDGEEVLVARSTWVFVDLATRRPKRIPADVAGRL